MFINLITKSLRYITDSDYRFTINNSRFERYKNMPDEVFLEKMFYHKMGYKLDLNNPKTFNEKLQWLKLFDRKTIYTKMADKYEVKFFVAERIGDKYNIPSFGIWDHFEEIDFDELPNQFVLKCTHDSGGISICKDKATWNKKAAREKLEKSLKNNYYYFAREWPYKDVKPRILAEKLLINMNAKDSTSSFSNQLVEYKLFCFYGEPKWFLVSMGSPHGEGRYNDFYDMNFKHIPVTVTHPNSPFQISKPKEYNELIDVARKLSADIPHVRVDTYVVNGHIYIGEMTFFHAAGFCQFRPKEYDRIFGEMFQLPKKR